MAWIDLCLCMLKQIAETHNCEEGQAVAIVALIDIGDSPN